MPLDFANVADIVRRPGLRAKDVKELARDLMLAKEAEPDQATGDTPLDITETSGRRGRAIVLLGAGCSISAGIPLATDVAKRCACLLRQRYSIDHSKEEDSRSADAALDDLIAGGVVPPRFQSDDGKGDWAELYKYFFADHLKSPNQQREIISRVIGESQYTLNWAHACLGALVKYRYVHTVLTTNFDQLALQGIIRSGITPVVADGLESLTRISPSPAWPQIVHLHGSMHTYDLRNSAAAIRETGNDRNLQTTMMSLLKQSTILMVVGYAGGEEGVMSLLQHAAINIPRMVVYWVAHEGSYLDLSSRARNLLETGDNKFFIVDQDADRFFQRLMRELGLGQPDWIANPIDALVKQGAELKGSHDDEISDLIDGYKKRVIHAHDHKLEGDKQLVDALQSRSAGHFDRAIKQLEPIRGRSRSHRRLYALSLQDAFEYDHESNAHRIDEAIEEFDHLDSRASTFSFGDAEALIKALFDSLESESESETTGEREDRLSRIVRVIERARKRLGSGRKKERAILNFYSARAKQELLDKKPENDRRIIEAYRSAVSARDALGDKLDEAREGLAQALVTYTEGRATAPGANRRTMQKDMAEAIEIQSDLVKLAWWNRSTSTFAAAMDNLASAFVVLEAVKRQPAQKRVALRDAIAALACAVEAHRMDGDSVERTVAAEARLDELRTKLGGPID